MVDIANAALMSGAMAPVMRDLTYAQVIFWATAIGIAGGLVATAYYYLLESSMHLVWQQVPEQGATYGIALLLMIGLSK